MQRGSRFNHGWRRQHGISMVEIMISITLSLILTAGLIQILVNNKQNYRIQDALSRLQENGRYAIDIITRDVRQAGFPGCMGRRINDEMVNTLNNNTLNNNTDHAWNFTIPIQGFDATVPPSTSEKDVTFWMPNLPLNGTDGSISNPLGGRDVLTIRHSVGDPIRVQNHPSASGPVQVSLNNGLSEGDVVMASNCRGAAVFQITSANPNASGNLEHVGGSNPGNAPDNNLHNTFDSKSEVVRAETVTYYIRTGSNGSPSLYRKVEADPAQELIEDVQDMVVRYGRDTNDDGVADDYVTANTIGAAANWAAVRIVSAEIRLLLRTGDDNLNATAQSYPFNGVNYNDRRLYKEFTATIAVRNNL